MIEVLCKEETLIYNTEHMARAFYPSEEVVSRVAGNEAPGGRPFPYVEVVRDGDRLAAVTQDDIRGSLDGHEVSADEKKERKYRIDRALYRQLCEKTGRSLAWGILMGVRPVKLAMQKCGQSQENQETREILTEEAFAEWFYREYLVSRKKGRLAYQIAMRERAILDKLDYGNGFSLYVGIPFCPSICSYCSFSSGEYRVWSKRIDEYLDVLCREIAFVAEEARLHEKNLNTIYIGGGTPTTLDAARLERLLAWIDRCFSFSRDTLLEYTVEAGRPDSISEEKLRVIKNHRVTRISINPQTMQQKTLDAVGRRHTVREVREAFMLARELGFDNINMDLIAGLPGETTEDMQDTLRQIKELSPDNLTVHALAIKRAARMGQEHVKAKSEEESPITAMIDAGYDAAGEMGMEPYYLYRQKNIAGNFENVGYAKLGKAGIYNILIMEEKQTIIACGAGSVSKRVHRDGRIERCENVKNIAQYIERIEEMIGRKRVLLNGKVGLSSMNL